MFFPINQRQIYLARWERELGFSRGAKIELREIKDWRLALIISTDVFYPQVSRRIALRGADIILSIENFTSRVSCVQRQIRPVKSIEKYIDMLFCSSIND